MLIRDKLTRPQSHENKYKRFPSHRKTFSKVVMKNAIGWGIMERKNSYHLLIKLSFSFGSTLIRLMKQERALLEFSSLKIHLLLLAYLRIERKLQNLFRVSFISFSCRFGRIRNHRIQWVPWDHEQYKKRKIWGKLKKFSNSRFLQKYLSINLELSTGKLE